MERIPEPELMEEAAQAEAYAFADFEAANAQFLAWVDARFPDLAATGAALDLGCGPADIPRRLAQARPGWRVDAVDGSAAMLAHARVALARAGVAGRVRLHHQRVPDLALPEPAYDLVVSNSLLHHLPEPGWLWQAIRASGRPGAAVLVMDLARPDSVAAAEALVATYSGGEPEVLQRDFLASLCAAYTPDEIAAQLAAAGLQLQLEIPSDRHWIAWGRIG